MYSKRFRLEVFVTRHARQRMAERAVDETRLLDLIETGSVRHKDENHLWLYKQYNERTDNLLCVAAVIGTVLAVKTVMHYWQAE